MYGRTYVSKLSKIWNRSFNEKVWYVFFWNPLTGNILGSCLGIIIWSIFRKYFRYRCPSNSNTWVCSIDEWLDAGIRGVDGSICTSPDWCSLDIVILLLFSGGIVEWLIRFGLWTLLRGWWWPDLHGQLEVHTWRGRWWFFLTWVKSVVEDRVMSIGLALLNGVSEAVYYTKWRSDLVSVI